MQISPAQRRHILSFLLVVLLFIVLWALGPILMPFVIAAVLAYVLHPIVELFAAKGQGLRYQAPRALWVAVVELLFLLVLSSLFFLILPILIKELPILREQIPHLLSSLSAWLNPVLARFDIAFSLDLTSIRAFLAEYLSLNTEDVSKHLLSSVKIGGNVALTILGNALLVPVILFYLLMEWDKLVEKLLSFIPKRSQAAVVDFCQETDAVMGQYLRGQLLVMFILAIFYSVGLMLFGLDLALPIGVFTGLAVFVPYLGFGLGLILALLAGLLQMGAMETLLMLAVVYGLGQILESFVFTPYLVGQRIGLHPLAIIFLLMAFGHLLGFVGVLLALPLSAVLAVALKRLQSSYKSSQFYLQ